ncbi:MAG TPA: hypothetical protein VGR85_01405 [Candidatus Limnocylindria bacterium]|nr:hypothetical protein [Candidatus Limnocylindria bacterium]
MPLGLAALALAWLGAGVWMTWTQSVYLRAYKRKLGEDVGFDPKYMDRPWLWFADAPRNLKRTFDVQLARQTDPELEVLRRRYIAARWAFFGSFIVLLLIGSLLFSRTA